MKLNKWLFGAAALAMMTACSDKDMPADPTTTPDDQGKFETTEGDGYIGISLELPQQPSSRANDQFDDGLAEEYKVDNAALLLFWGNKDDEANAEFIGAYKIGSDERFDQPSGDNITTSFQNVATLNKKITPDANKQLWGLALVNYDSNIFKIEGNPDNSTDPNYGKLTVVAKKIDPTTESVEAESNITITPKTDTQKGMIFSEFRKLITGQALYKTTTGGVRIFMTNAPLSSSPGGSTSPNGASGYTIQTLAKLDASKIYDVKETARVNPAGCIFVERAVAKISLSSFPMTATLKYQPLKQTEDGIISADGDPEDVTLNVVSLGWLLDNEENDSYLVRNAQISTTNIDEDIWTMRNPVTSPAPKSRYRFVGSQPMPTTIEDNAANHNWYRTYWCRDPRYSTNKDFNEEAKVGPASSYENLLDASGNFVDTHVLYPRENTFSVANQNYKNTTRVVFRVQYEWKDEKGNPLNVYCKAGDPSIIYMKPDAEKFLLSAFISNGTLNDIIAEYVDGKSAYDNGIATKTTVTNSDGTTTDTYNIKYYIEHFDFESISENVEGKGKLLQLNEVTVKEAGPLGKSLKGGDKTVAALNQALEAVIEEANSEVSIRSFADETNNNVCYYATNIQHFGDDDCPMDMTVDANNKPVPDYRGITTDVVYENGNRERYLGRWGMVRNNWYDLTIGNIFNMGYADVPDGNVETSDDNNKEEYYLAVRVHVLSWAKRTQSVDF